MFDTILERLGLKYEDLSKEEKTVLNGWMETLKKKTITLQNIRDYISSMKESVEQELTKEPEYKTIFIFKVRNDNNIFLKARLRNYLLLEAYLLTPEKAQKALETYIEDLSKRLGRK